ncbi:MAG TPA: aminopeptidase P family protein [Acidimicrobiales bacterium]|nr:aminopeptidase P family protein [Acidimicrobiales bacterium]
MSDYTEPDVSAEQPLSENWVWIGAHRPAMPRVFLERLAADWAPSDVPADEHVAAEHTRRRRDALAQRLPGLTLVIPSGNLKVRANDTDYRFRPDTDYFYLTADDEPEGVLVITPTAGGSRSTLYVPARRDQRTHEFITDARYGELWVGPRRGPEEASAYYGIATAPLEELAKDLVDLAATPILTNRGVDDWIDSLVAPHDNDNGIAEALSEMRLVKDDFEIAQLESAIAHTVKGFEDVVRALPSAEGRGERVIEGVFNLRARVEGNDVGYNTIAASGSHATTLHWTQNNGVVRSGDLLLLDAGVECLNLYTADVTRTMPVNGTFSPAQRRVYDLVLAAQEAGIAAVRPGASFRAPHEAAMKVLAEGLHELGILDESAESALRADRQLYRRYTLHGVSHMLGLDVHDCANARDELYMGELKEGYVLTVEPGLYFQPHDLTVPEEYRGIGVRIEDDILVTASGARNLSAALPRHGDDVEAWMAEIWSRGATNLGL